MSSLQFPYLHLDWAQPPVGGLLPTDTTTTTKHRIRFAEYVFPDKTIVRSLEYDSSLYQISIENADGLWGCVVVCCLFVVLVQFVELVFLLVCG